ncbi:MAG TPA: ABC transporter substrate-binding protein [Phototrophicaceae bacterium]|nr:ABC transporter substrate-binding protein [Phototrophicaceae bacterium]
MVGLAPVAAQAKTELVYGIDNNVDTLDPNITSYSSVGIIMAQVVEPLVWQNPLGTYHPGLATDWTVNADATEYTFHLRKDVKFQDGTPFNADAVKFTFDRIVDPDNKSQTAISLIGPYQETDVVDDYTVVVKFKTPFAPFLDSVSQPYLGIVSPTAVKTLGADFGQKTVIGTGPFKIANYVPDSEVDLVRNDDYNWGSQEVFGITGPSALSKITFKIVQEPSTRTAALESGDADFIDDVPTTDYDNLKDSGQYTMTELTQPGAGWSLQMNQEKAPTDDLQVRKAIALASDKAGMLATVFNGFGTTACSAVTKVMFGYDPNSCNDLPYDPTQAGQILDADGWTMNTSTGIREKNGQPLTIEHYFRSDSPTTVAMATFMQADLAKVGIQVNLNGLAQAGYFDAVRSGKHNTQNWWDTETDPDGVVRTLFSSANAGGGTNRSNYKSDMMDKLIDQGAGTSDLTQRVAIYSQIQKLADDDAVMVYYVDPYLLFGGVTNLTGIQFLGGGTLPNFYGASFGS